tara:strand:+ start:237 stop:1022 length:786 start_codon:yes stop_codon:yes gene_type:complete
MGKKLGYTFYPKDWRANDEVFELSLQEKGFYRELLDQCFLESSAEIEINRSSFTRKHKINSRTYSKLIQKLCESSLILLQNNCETLIVIPSVYSRLGVINEASNGGKKSSREGIKNINNGEKKVTKENRIEENIIEKKGKGKEESPLSILDEINQRPNSGKLDPNDTEKKIWFEENTKDYPNQQNIYLGLKAWCNELKPERGLIIKYLFRYSEWFKGEESPPFAPQIKNVIENKTYLDTLPESKAEIMERTNKEILKNGLF